MRDWDLDSHCVSAGGQFADLTDFAFEDFEPLTGWGGGAIVIGVKIAVSGDRSGRCDPDKLSGLEDNLTFCIFDGQSQSRCGDLLTANLCLTREDLFDRSRSERSYRNHDWRLTIKGLNPMLRLCG